MRRGSTNRSSIPPWAIHRHGWLLYTDGAWQANSSAFLSTAASGIVSVMVDHPSPVLPSVFVAVDPRDHGPPTDYDQGAIFLAEQPTSLRPNKFPYQVGIIASDKRRAERCSCWELGSQEGSLAWKCRRSQHHRPPVPLSPTSGRALCRSRSSASEVVFSAPVADVVSVSTCASRSRASSKAVRSTASETGDWPTPTIHRFVGKGLAWRRRMTATALWAVRATPAAVDPDRSRLECVTPFQPTQIMAAER